MLNDGIKPKIDYDRDSIADLCKNGTLMPFIEFVGGVSITTQIDIDFKTYDNVSLKLSQPKHTAVYICHTDLQALVRYPHRKIAIQYGQIINPYDMETGEHLRLSPQGYSSPELIDLFDYYRPNEDYFYEVIADDILFSERQIQNYIDVINDFADLTTTPADTISEPLKGIAKVNHDKDRAKTFACIVAKFLWDMDTEKRIRTGKMATHIYALVHEFDSKATTQRPENVKEWLKSIAPDYAKKGGNEPKDPPPIILTLKN